MRCQRAKYLFVMGANEGALPGYGGTDGVLTDQERTALRNLEVPLTGGALDGIQTEFSEVYGVFCGASEHITVSCSTAEPSYVYRRLRDMVGIEDKVENCFVTADSKDAAYYLAYWGNENAAAELGLEQEFSQALHRRAHNLGTICRENVNGLYGEKLMLSASKVDRQAECRLSFFLKYGLRARERKEATVDPAEFGTYVHDVLENTAREVVNLGGFHQVSCEETLKIAKKYSDKYVSEHFSDLDSSRVEYLFRRNIQELDLIVRELWEELSVGKYEPVEFELHFGEGGPMEPIHVPSQSMPAELEGYVDRVDAWKCGSTAFFRVVDYKTGTKDFDYCDVFNGVGLQMLLYLFALEQEGEQILGGGRIAAGVQYFPARVPYVNLGGAGEDEQEQRRKNWLRQGLLLGDELSLEAMDPELERLCCSRKKDGTLVGDLASRDQLKLLRQYVFRVLGRMVDDIASGNVQPNPYTRGTSHNACQFCPYQSICHSDCVAGRRNYKAMKPDRFWDEIGKEMDSHG
jgi:ATP-dependent helicase/nuclease subunit B